VSPRKPRVFIASSEESVRIAQAVQSNLADLEVTVWSQGLFRLSTSGLDALLETLSRFDFAVFVFMPEDVVVIRGKKAPVVRDNLIFELGLFLGRLGPRRSFIVTPGRLQDLHLPSDLHGITVATFDAERIDNLQAALAPACSRIRQAIESLTPPPRPPATGRFAELIAQHEGIHTANPAALAIDLLPNSNSIRGDVARYLGTRGWSMPVEEITMRGIAGTEDLVSFVEALREKRLLFQERDVSEVHLFYAGPDAAAALIGVFWSNWIPIKLYHREKSDPERFYDYWAPLEKI